MYVMPLTVIFYAFASIAVLSALVVITTRNPVRSVLALVVTFFAMAGVWMLLHAEFLSLILLLVYVGAVMTLFLFVVMMLNVHTKHKKKFFVSYLPLAALMVLLLTAVIILALTPGYFHLAGMTPSDTADNLNNTALIGAELYTTYAYPFEVAGVILLAAIIAAITLSHRKPRSKTQDVTKQIQVRPEDRLRIIKMPATKAGE